VTDHRHPHTHGDASVRGLKWALGLTAGFLLVEVVGAFASNSLALLADAGHMLLDVAALGLSLFVAFISRKPATQQKTYGYWRWEILAAFLNGGTLLSSRPPSSGRRSRASTTRSRSTAA